MILQRHLHAEPLTVTAVQPVVDPAGLVAFQVPPDRLLLLMNDLPEGHRAEPVVGELRHRRIGGDQVEDGVVGDLAVPADAQVDAAVRGADLGGLQQHAVDAAVSEDPV
ncbi:hypothetical protein [Nonomuraea endophytica]|uniref:hypothetical protein n=1 Tax=Nonomuraea endophytica TaxID=714136 RepID=UPI001612EFA8|nr:hypothetical protein [Nonomuraea endophytica]